MTDKIRVFSYLWFLVNGLLGLFTYWRSESYFQFQFSRALQFPYDPYGRPLWFIISRGWIESMVLILSLALFFIIVSTLLSYLSRKVQWIEIFTESLQVIPALFLGLFFGMWIQSQLLALLFSGLILVVPQLVRVLSSKIQILMDQEYIQSSIALGSRPWYRFHVHTQRILMETLWNIFPGIFSKLLGLVTTLSFFGITLGSSDASLGKTLYTARLYFIEAPWLLILTMIPYLITILVLPFLFKKE